ncbi:MAG: acetyl-CoA acetyltransferase [Bacteroidota bacterium]
MKDSKVYILGGAQSDFAHNWSKQGAEIGDILKDSFEKALIKCEIEEKDIDSVHLGNFVGELFSGQGQLGGLLIQHFPKLSGKPSARHEAACASGSMAAFAAMREIEVGLYDVVAVVGVEMMRNVDGKTAAQHLGAAAWIGHEAEEALYPWVYLFSEIRDFYQERYGVKAEHLSAIAQTNYSHAKNNPFAQSRNWQMQAENFGSDDTLNPIIEGSLRKSDCGRITDGSATVFLASEKFAKEYAQKRGLKLEDIPSIKGWGHATAPIQLAYKLAAAPKTDYAFPHVQKAIEDALSRAKLSGASDLDAIETHDCFTISEYVALEHFGLAKAGEAWKLIEEDSISMKGSLPINPSGGLIGAGHPVGATGVRMLLDAYKQASGNAGEYQVENAKDIGILNIGGSFTTVASFVVGR